MDGKTYKYIAIVSIIALSGILYFVLIQSDPGFETISSYAEDVDGTHESITADEQNEGDLSLTLGIEEPSTDSASSQTRETIESPNLSQPIESGWRILDNYDNPQAGVHVVCTPISTELVQEWLALEEAGQEPKPDFYETYTDKNGCFDYPFLEHGSYLLRADALHWSPALGVLDYRDGRPDDFSAVMVKEQIIRGKVLNCDQEPIEEASVYCYMSPTFPIEKMPLHCAGEVLLFKQHVQTDEEGLFSFSGLYPDLDYDLYVEYEDHKPLYKVVSKDDRNDQIIILKKTCILEGRITSQSGEPLPEATILYTEPQSPYIRPHIEPINEEGYFRCDSVPEGFIFLQGMHADYGHETVKLNVKRDRVNFTTLKLPKGIKLRITVTDEQDTPLEGIVVSVDSQDTGAFISTYSTNGDGEVIIHSINKGNRNSIRTRDPHYRYSVYKKTHTFNEDAELHIRLNKRHHAQMIVMDESTKEVISDYNICVSSYYHSSALRETDSLNACTYEFEIQSPSHEFPIALGEFFEITVFADGYMPERVIAMFLSEGEVKPYKVYLKPGIVLNACVVDAFTSEPISDGLVQYCVNGRYDKKPGFSVSIDRTATTKEDGTFSLSGMPNHRFFLKVNAPGYSPAVIDSMELDLSAPATANCIHLNRGGILSGRIFSQENLPLDQANIQVRLTDTNELLTTRSNPDGNYGLYDLPPGEYVVSAWELLDKIATDSTMKLQKTVEILPGQTTTANFTFEGSCIIRGLCTADGQEGCGIIINLFDEKGIKTHSVDASSTGYYKIFGLKHGKYTLEAHSTVIGAGGMIRRPISLQSGQDLTLDLEFKGKAVFGTVTDTEGHPLHAAEVEILTPTFQRNYLTYTDHKGNYAILNVDEGNYYIAARAPSCGEEMKGPWVLGGAQKAGRKVDFALKPGGVLRMHVNDSQGNPIPKARVLLSNNMSQGVLWTEKTKYSGIAVFDNLQTESLSALAIAKGYAAGSTTLLAPAGEITDAEITLVQGGSFKVTVKSKNGIPVSGAHVALTDFLLLGLSPTRLTQLGLLSPSNPGYLTDEEGGFSIGLLPPGNYKLQITKGNRVAQASVSITSGQETGVQVVIE